MCKPHTIGVRCVVSRQLSSRAVLPLCFGLTCCTHPLPVLHVHGDPVACPQNLFALQWFSVFLGPSPKRLQVSPSPSRFCPSFKTQLSCALPHLASLFCPGSYTGPVFPRGSNLREPSCLDSLWDACCGQGSSLIFNCLLSTSTETAFSFKSGLLLSFLLEKPHAQPGSPLPPASFATPRHILSVFLSGSSQPFHWSTPRLHRGSCLCWTF